MSLGRDRVRIAPHLLRATMKRILGRLRDDFLHFIAPSICPGCEELLQPSERHWCDGCRSTIDPAPFPAEIYSSMTERFGHDGIALSGVASLMRYEEGSLARRLIHAVKYHGAVHLGVDLGRGLARYLSLHPQLFDDVDLVVPVPLHSARHRERGYNQAECIANGIVSGGIGRGLSPALRRTRHMPSQTRLDAEERQANITGAFGRNRCANDVRGRIVLLCDDVLTTGATLNACAETLLNMGAARVVAATVARDEPLQESEMAIDVLFGLP